MRRYVLFASVLFGLGLVTAVGVAWIFAALSDPGPGYNRFVTWSDSASSIGNGWKLWELTGPGKQMRLLKSISDETAPGLVYDDTFDPPDWSAARSPAGEDAKPVYEYARGWPFLSLRCAWLESENPFDAPNEPVKGGVVIRGLAPDWMCEPPDTSIHYTPDWDFIEMEERRALPFVPMWLGLIASSFLYAAVWAPIIGVAASPAMMRRFLRRRRKKCIRCGYWLRGIASNRCPECGWEVGRRYPLLTNSRIAIAVTCLVVMVVADAALAWWLIDGYWGPGAIHIAAGDNDVARVSRLLEGGAFVDEPSDCGGMRYWEVDGSTPLMWAAAHGGVETMRLLLDKGADPDARRFFSETALMLAARWGQLGAARLLLESGADIAAVDLGESRALMIAAGEGHGEVVELLLESGSDVEAMDCEGQTAMHWAAGSGTPRCLQLLLEAGASANPPASNGLFMDGWTALGGAAAAGRIDNMRVLIEAGAELDAGPVRPLAAALEAGQSEAALLLIEAGASTGPDAGSLLWRAAESNLTEVARVLLAAGADPNEPCDSVDDPGWTPLRRAVIRSNVELAKMLVEAGGDPHVKDDEDESLLFCIFWWEASPEFVDYVFSFGIDVNHQSTLGNTALIDAVRGRHVEGVRRLLNAGADPRIKNDMGYSALDYAERRLPYVSGGMRSEGYEPDAEIVELVHQAVEQPRG